LTTSQLTDITLKESGRTPLQELCCEKGKLVARRGRKAQGPLYEAAGLPNR